MSTSPLSAIAQASHALRNEGLPFASLVDAHGRLTELIAAGDRVTAAFRALGLDSSLINRSRLVRECEESMVALDAALARAKGGGA